MPPQFGSQGASAATYSGADGPGPVEFLSDADGAIQSWMGAETSGRRNGSGWEIVFTGEGGGLVRCGADGRWVDIKEPLETDPFDCMNLPGSAPLNVAEQFRKLRHAQDDEVAQTAANKIEAQMSKGAVRMREQSFGEILWGGEPLWEELAAASVAIGQP